MYEVFLNENRIVFAEAYELSGEIQFTGEEIFKDEVTAGFWFSEFVSSGSLQANIVCISAEETLKIFRKAFINIWAAGGMVHRKGETLYIFRNGKWDLPKGKIDDNETAEKAALREVSEECGISGLIITGELPATYHIYQSEFGKTKNKWIFKETYWFKMVYNEINNGTPQINEGIEKVVWIEDSEKGMVLENSYGNIKKLIKNHLGDLR